jgi:hypothetical protein
MALIPSDRQIRHLNHGKLNDLRRGRTVTFNVNHPEAVLC